MKMDVRARVKRRDRHRCLACGSTRNLTMDHILPQCMGGNNEPENLQTLCAMCNNIKGDEDIDFITMGREAKKIWLSMTSEQRIKLEMREAERKAQRKVNKLLDQNE